MEPIRANINGKLGDIIMLDNKIKGQTKSSRRQDIENFYITSDMIYDEWIKWRDSAQAVKDRQPTAQLCDYIIRIANGILGKSSFREYSDDLKQDIISDALLKCLKNLKNLKEDRRESFFNYLSRCIHCQIYTSLKKHYKQINIKRMLMEKKEI